MSMLMDVHLESIRLDPLLQARVTMDQSVVIEYAEAMEAGDQFPPIVVFDDGTTMWLADGWHRVEAARSVRGMTQIAAEIREGTRRDAMLYGAGANANHGLRRTNRDKRLIVARLLTDAEWAQWSDREIARACHVSHPFVAKIRAELAQAASGNVSRQRTFERGGTVSTMDTAPIAEANEERAAESVRTEPREVTPYPGLNRDVCETDRKLLAEAEEQRASMRTVETLAGSTTTIAWVPTAAEESEIPLEPVKPSMLGPRDGGGDGWTTEYGLGRDRLAPIWRLEQAIEQYLDARHGIRGMNDQNPDVRLATVSAIVADDFGEEFDEFEPYIEQPYRQGDLRQALNNVAEQLRQAIARMEAKPQNPWAPALTPRPREARETEVDETPGPDATILDVAHGVRARAIELLKHGMWPKSYQPAMDLAGLAHRLAEMVIADAAPTPPSLDESPVDESAAVGHAVTWPGKEGELVRWDAGGRIAVVCDEQGIEYRIPRFMVDVHDHENPGV